MYHAKVVVTRKVRKNDLPVKSGDTVGIIRTTSCPKGKWLARDFSNKCEFSRQPSFPLGWLSSRLQFGLLGGRLCHTFSTLLPWCS